MTKELELNIPTSISSIPLKHYQDYIKMYSKWNKEDEVYFKTKVLQIFCGLDVSEVYNLPIASFDNIVDHVLSLISQNDNKLIKKFTMTGKNIKGEATVVDFGFHPNLHEMSFGEFIDLENYMKDWSTMHKAMSVLYRPIYHEKKEFYQIDKYEGSSKYSDVMLDMPLDVALGANVFFYRLGSKLPLLTMDYLQRVLKEQGVPQQLKPILGENGDGINRYILLLKEMSEESIKLQNKGFINAY